MLRVASRVERSTEASSNKQPAPKSFLLLPFVRAIPRRAGLSARRSSLDSLDSVQDVLDAASRGPGQAKRGADLGSWLLLGVNPSSKKAPPVVF